MESESPFQHVLHTNYSPVGAEIDEIRSFSALSLHEIDKLDDEIASHRDQAIIAPLKAKRARYQESVDNHQALLSPVRRVLPELLQQIFRWCLPEHPILDYTAPPLLLGRICNDWRILAYGTVELWSTLHIVLPSADNTSLSPAQLATPVSEWLKRAGSLPLNISVISQQPVGDISSVLCNLLEFGEQWQTLILDIPKIALLDIIPLIPPTQKFAMLRSLKIRLMPSSPQENGIAWVECGDLGLNSLLRLVTTHPSLQHLEIQLDPTIGWVSDLPLAQNAIQETLTSLSLDLQGAFVTLRNPSERFLNLLAAFPNLTRCCISSCHFTPAIMQPTPGLPAVIPRVGPVHLEKLETLAIRLWTRHLNTPELSPFITDILDGLVTPSLTRFDFGAQKDKGCWFRRVWQCLMRLQARSSSSLTKLCIRRDSHRLGEILGECLLQCPDLQELIIERTDQSFPMSNHDERIGNTVLDIVSNDNSICPNLNTVSLFNFSPSQLEESALLSFLHRRTRMSNTPFQFGLLPALKCSIWHSSWNIDVEPVDGWESPEYSTNFLQQIDELKSSTGVQINLGDVEKWASSAPWFGFEDD